MYTQCPECLTIYPLEAGALAQAHGHVRCGHCTMVFDALPSLVEVLPPDPVSGLLMEDIDSALADLGETFDISREDLALLLARAEVHAAERIHKR